MTKLGLRKKEKKKKKLENVIYFILQISLSPMNRISTLAVYIYIGVFRRSISRIQLEITYRRKQILERGRIDGGCDSERINEDLSWKLNRKRGEEGGDKSAKQLFVFRGWK